MLFIRFREIIGVSLGIVFDLIEFVYRFLMRKDFCSFDVGNRFFVFFYRLYSWLV